LTSQLIVEFWFREQIQMAEIQATPAKPDPLHDATSISEEEFKVNVTVAALPSEVLGQTFALLSQHER
jgi:hypothetical protein